jgi:hypothetical protein
MGSVSVFRNLMPLGWTNTRCVKVSATVTLMCRWPLLRAYIRWSKQTKRVSVAVTRLHAVLAGLPAVRQRFLATVIFTCSWTLLRVYLVWKQTGPGSVTDMCISTIEASLPATRQGFRHCYIYVQVSTVTSIHRMQQQKGAFRYCHACVWATPPYSPSFSSSYSRD